MDLLTAPAPLTRQQRNIVIGLGAIAALSRFLARAQTFWDWDEALFILGMREYDVASHHPHPPGFPVYIALGRAVRVLAGDDFRSLQAINLAAGVLLFPALFLLCRELRLRFEVCALAATLCAFLPSVWIFGGTAFSDVPSIVLVLFAVWLLLRGCRDRRTYLAGAFVLALAVGIRPQNILVGLCPGFLATRERLRRSSWRDVLIAALIGGAVAGGAFFGAARATGTLDSYLNAVRGHGEYISRVDSWRSPERPSLIRLVDPFFFKQYQSPPMNVVMTLFVLVSVVGSVRSRDRRIGTVALSFAPFMAVAWLMLDRYSVNRFSIGYIPLFAILGADGMMRVSGGRTRVTFAIGGVVVLAFVAFTWPALAVVRNEPSPTYAVASAARTTLQPGRDRLYVTPAMVPFAEVLLPDMEWFRVTDRFAIPLSSSAARPWLLAEGERTTREGFEFRRGRRRLWNIVRRHYFETSLEPLRNIAEFGEGWYPPVREGHDERRWMSGRGVIRLPSVARPAVLRVAAELPEEGMTPPPLVTLTLNGSEIEAIRPASPQVEGEIALAAGSSPNVLQIVVERVSTQASRRTPDDARELGLKLRGLTLTER